MKSARVSFKENPCVVLFREMMVSHVFSWCDSIEALEYIGSWVILGGGGFLFWVR